MGSNADLAQQGHRMRLHAARLAASIDARAVLSYAGVALVSLYAFLYGTGDVGILDGNEALYVESAREMALTHALAVPTLNGLPYLEKPPLFIWLIAAMSGVAHSVELGPRLVSVGAGLVLVFGVLRFAARLGIGRQGTAAAFMLATCVGTVLMARVAMPDMLLTALFALCCLSFLVALRENRIGFARLAAGLLGAASLVKGLLPAMLFGLIVIACHAMEKPWRHAIRRFLCDPWAILLALAPMLGWLLAIDSALPGAASYFIVDEHILRFLGLREPRDYYSGSIVYYLPRLALFFFPWSGVLLFGWFARNDEASVERRQTGRFLWSCVLIPLAFFSVSSAKANYYILVCLPPMALLAANYLPALLQRRARLPFALAVVLPGVIVAGGLAAAMGMADNVFSASLRRDGTAAAIAIAAAMLCAALVLRSGRRRLALACLALSMAPLPLQLQRLASSADDDISARSVAALIRDRYGDSLPVFLFEDYEALGALPIYLDRTVPVIDSKSSDLDFGRRVLKRAPTLVSAAHVQASGGPALVVVLKNRQQDFERTALAARAAEVARTGRATLFRVAPEGSRGSGGRALVADPEGHVVGAA